MDHFHRRYRAFAVAHQFLQMQDIEDGVGLMDVSKKISAQTRGFCAFFCVEMIQSVFSWVEIGRFLTVTLIPRVCSIHMMYERVIFQAISAAAKHSSVKEINDRKGYLAFKHRHGEQMHKVFDPLRGGTT